MKKVSTLLVCLCLAFLIHFRGGVALRVDTITWGSNGTIWATAPNSGKQIIIPPYQILYIEEV